MSGINKNIKKLTIGLITPSHRVFNDFKFHNPEHKTVWVNTLQSIMGVRFDMILKGENWHRCSKEVLDTYHRRIY